MSPEKLEKIEEIFHAALELPASERSAFLNSQTDDPEMLREVNSLLSFEGTPNSLIDSSPEQLAAELVEADNGENQIVGREINQYKVLSLLGIGGMGAVFLARDTKLERKVAIKILSGEFATDSVRLNRFFREAKSASALNHPNIITVHEIGETDGAHFIVTEFIDGRTLGRYLSEENPSLEKVVEIATQIASALAAAHEAGIVHRDVKPDNVMVRADGIVKVLDFGIAKLIESGESPDSSPVSHDDKTLIAPPRTVPGMIIGTPQYMSPEQARGQVVDFRSDIFSFGVVLYEMLSGQPPFSGTTHIDVIGAIIRDEPKPLSELEPQTTGDLERIVGKALRKDRELRYQHIRDLLIDLNDAKKTLSIDSKPLGNTEAWSARRTAETASGIAGERRFSLIHLAGFLVLLIAVGAAVWYFLPTKTSVATTAEAPLKSVEVFTWASTPGESYSTGSFSPDGKMVAFASAKGGARSIWIKQATSGETLQVTKDAFNNEQPIWSPNGEEIAFFSNRGNQTGVWRTPILGGSPKFIATVADGSLLLRYWSPGGLIYFESASSLSAIDVATGQIKQIADLGPEIGGATSINISRDEKSVVYVTTENEKWSLSAKSVAGGEPKKLVTADAEIKNTAFHNDGRRIFYSALTNGTFQTFVTDTAGSPARQITFSDRDSFVLENSPDGSRILLGSAKEDSDIWRLELKSDKETAFASDINFELWAAVAPDGKSVAFQSVKTLSQGNNLFNGKLLVRRVDSTDQPVEVSPDGFLPVWSPDGQKIAFMEITGKVARIATVAAGGGQKTTVAAGVTVPAYSILPYNRTQTADFGWSPDSRRIVYRSSSGGRQNVFVAGSDGGEALQVTANEDARTFFYSPLWSPDGKFIALTSKSRVSGLKETYAVLIFNVEAKTSRTMTQSTAFMRLIDWDKTGTGVIIASTEDSETSALHREIVIAKVNGAGGNPETVVKLKDAYLANIHLSPDGKTIAFGANRDGKDNIWLVAATGGEARQVTQNNDARMYFSNLVWSPDSGSVYYGKQSRFSLLSMLTDFK